MSILIKGMDMPSGLAERGFVIRGDGRVRTFTGMPIEGCYAIEVPTPHGRLIDADELETDTEWDIYLDDFISYSKEQIKNAPTIIGVEEHE